MPASRSFKLPGNHGRISITGGKLFYTPAKKRKPAAKKNPTRKRARRK